MTVVAYIGVSVFQPNSIAELVLYLDDPEKHTIFSEPNFFLTKTFINFQNYHSEVWLTGLILSIFILFSHYNRANVVTIEPTPYQIEIVLNNGYSFSGKIQNRKDAQFVRSFIENVCRGRIYKVAKIENPTFQFGLPSYGLPTYDIYSSVAIRLRVGSFFSEGRKNIEPDSLYKLFFHKKARVEVLSLGSNSDNYNNYNKFIWNYGDWTTIKKAANQYQMIKSKINNYRAVEIIANSDIDIEMYSENLDEDCSHVDPLE